MTIDRLVTTREGQPEDTFDWGTITWLDSAELTDSTGLTVGRVTIEAGRENTEHRHPDCAEALFVLAGELVHTIGDEETTLREGDLLHVPPGERHQAHNPSDDDAVALLAYDTGERTIEFVD